MKGLPAYDGSHVALIAQLGAVRALHRHRRGRGFESRSGPEFFQWCYGRTCINGRQHPIATNEQN